MLLNCKLIQVAFSEVIFDYLFITIFFPLCK